MAEKELFALQISDLDNAAKISRKWATHTVSVLDSELAKRILGIDSFYEKRIPKPRDGLLLHRSYFDDVIPENDLGLAVANLEDIQAILDFTKDLSVKDKLLVHCSAGISRSTAVATGILCQHGLTPTAALNKVRAVRKAAHPNEHVIALMDDALDLNGSLEKAFKALPPYI